MIPRYSGKGSVFNKNLMKTPMTEPDAKELIQMMVAAVLKNVGTRVLVSEETLASVRNKVMAVAVEEREDQNYLILTLEDRHL